MNVTAAPHAFDRALGLRRVDSGRYHLPSDRSWWNHDAAFGGWIAALAGKAALAEADDGVEVLTQTTNYAAPLGPETIQVDVERVRAGRKTAFWHVRLADAATGEVLVTSDVVTGARRERKLEWQPAPSKLPEPETAFRIEPMQGMPRWLKHFEQRMIYGRPFQANDRPESMVAVRSVDGRPLDATMLLALADIPLPRVFLMGPPSGLVATISMTTQIMAGDADIAAAGDDYVLVECGCAGVRHGLQNQETRIFRRDGLLLAISYQIARY
ncbi:MAG: thioesterase family protein [Pseudomonadota bacterium]|nr:thioesterase family protein [Pseudomonadota bacterium]